MFLKENPRFGNIHDIQKHLDAAGVGYLNSINGTTPESLIATMKKLSPFARALVYPETVASVGIGQGEEIEALYELFGRNGTKLIGIDISELSLRSSVNRMERNGIPFSPIMASATNIPLKEGSVNGVVFSSILHEVYSYHPDGILAWEDAILEAHRVLTGNGALFLRDPAAPYEKIDIEIQFLSTMSQDFYRYFCKEFRVFTSWDKENGQMMLNRRLAHQEDYPSLGTLDSVVLPFGKAAEIMLHFRNFWNDYQKGLVKIGDPAWKEIDEVYLLPDYRFSGDTLSVDEYTDTVLSVVNHIPGNNPQMICIQSGFVTSPDTNSFLTRHFSLSRVGSKENHTPVSSLALIDQTTRKMELVFKKVVS